jgi:hypothetical protein
MLDHVGRKALLRSTFLRNADSLCCTALSQSGRISYTALIGRKNPLSSTTWRV